MPNASGPVRKLLCIASKRLQSYMSSWHIGSPMCPLNLRWVTALTQSSRSFIIAWTKPLRRTSLPCWHKAGNSLMTIGLEVLGSHHATLHVFCTALKFAVSTASSKSKSQASWSWSRIAKINSWQKASVLATQTQRKTGLLHIHMAIEKLRGNPAHES